MRPNAKILHPILAAICSSKSTVYDVIQRRRTYLRFSSLGFMCRFRPPISATTALAPFSIPLTLLQGPILLPAHLLLMQSSSCTPTFYSDLLQFSDHFRAVFSATLRRKDPLRIFVLPRALFLTRSLPIPPFFM